MFTEKYGELCRGIDCTNIKSCNECNIGKKLNLCAKYEDIQDQCGYDIGEAVHNLSAEILRLKDELQTYKDTGLTPDAIHNLEDITRTQSNSIIKMGWQGEELEEKCNYWELEAKKWCDQLGEIRILATQELCDK